MCRIVAAEVACIAVCLAVSLARPSDAERLGKGRSLLQVGISGHTGQFAYPGFTEIQFQNEEVGGEIGYSRFLSDQWSLGICGGYHAGQEKSEDKSTNTTRTLDTHSYTVRIGSDRYAFIGDRVALYAGPGAFFARGRATSKLTGTKTVEGTYSTELGLDARVGMYAHLGENIALFTQIGQVLSHTSAEDATARTTWWSSTQEGSLGLAFDH